MSSQLLACVLLNFCKLFHVFLLLHLIMIMPNVPIISQNQIRDVTYMFVDGRMVVAIETFG
jgi:hypothetical protein